MKCASHFFSTAAPSWTSPLAVNWQSLNTFIALSQPFWALMESTTSSSVMDFSMQTIARARVKVTDTTTARAARQVLKNIASFLVFLLVQCSGAAFNTANRDPETTGFLLDVAAFGRRQPSRI